MNFVRDVWAVLLIPILTAIVVAIGVVAAKARDNGQWANAPEHVRQWFQSLKQPDHPRQSCCGEADAFEADSFVAEGDHYVRSSPTARARFRTARASRCPTKR